MTVRLAADGTVELSGRCVLEDAEELRKHLAAAPRCTVQWEHCESLHSAVLQVLMAARPRLRGTPRSEFLDNHIRPLIASTPEAS
jgi:hypothetical protein